MKFYNYKVLIPCFAVLLITVAACKKSFLEINPKGPLSESVLATKAGVDGLLIGTYSLLDGVYNGNGNPLGPWESAGSNWIYGSVASDDAHKGSTYDDQPEIYAIEGYASTSVLNHFNSKWRAVYNGVQRANDVLRIMRKASGIAPADTLQIAAEARFLRGFYHLEAVKMWGAKVPYVGENITYENGNFNVPNDASILPQIEADFKFAADNLTASKAQIGRVNKWAATAFWGKALMIDQKYAEAIPVLTSVITTGTTPAGVKYDLAANYEDNFDPTAQINSPEVVLAYQSSTQDQAGGWNGNAGDALNFPGGGPASCCGFNQPSFDLVDAYKVDAAGLPMFGTYNAVDLKNDMGIKGTDAFTPTTEAIDSRLDWTVGRRGIPYLDWGVHPGESWVRGQYSGGPYTPKKSIYMKAAQASTSDFYAGWAANQTTANNINLMRFADVLLLAAEANVEAGSQATAEIYINRVRTRAASPQSMVHTYVDASDPSKGFTNIPAANYKVGLYTGQVAGGTKAFAREAVRFERRLELGMEGHRFFDLQRYDMVQPGYMASTLNAYIAHETTVPIFGPKTGTQVGYSILLGAKFTQGQDEVFPIPQRQIDISGGMLKPNQNK
ncbi:MAG: RagB/SusD family nutrient uptake outer membrane protein [Sphingobacteriales bacterium]|nr:RagB/SusD family nutrient uptake outer membrane protein [Sphingobacteriales bacterium]